MAALSSGPSSKRVEKNSRSVYEAVIERIVEHNVDTRSFFLRLPTACSLAFIPGQFLSFLLPISGQNLTRAYSIASDPEDGNLLEICFNLVPGGLGSRYLFARQVGEVLQFTGPWGAFVIAQPPETECVFIADHVGVAPIRPMVKCTLSFNHGKPVRLLYGARRKEALLYYSEFQNWRQHDINFSFDPLLLEPPAQWRELTGSLLETVEKQYVRADNNRNRHFYICGIGSQVAEIRDLLRQAGYLRRAVQYERW